MRPVNLIPPDQRRGDRAPLRAGSLSYVVIGALAAALIGVVMLVTTGNTIAEHKNDVDRLQGELESAQQEAQALKPYADFASLRVSREATITSLAKSRFDWQRVMRELALVVPSDIALTHLSGQTSPDSPTGSDSSSASGLAGATTGPSITLSGCGKDHDAVARFLADLQDIDGVTRVGLQSSTRAAEGGTSGGAATSSGIGGSCSGKGHPAQFEILATFDGVPAPQVAGAAPATAAPTGPVPASSPATSPPPTSEPASATNPGDGVSDGAAEIQASKDSAATKTDKAKKVAGLFAGGGGK